jgi:hypothetical protein
MAGFGLAIFDSGVILDIVGALLQMAAAMPVLLPLR